MTSITQVFEKVDIINQDQALSDFKERSGFAEAIAQLDANPLPPVLVVQPATTHASPQASELLLSEFEIIPEKVVAKIQELLQKGFKYERLIESGLYRSIVNQFEFQ